MASKKTLNKANLQELGVEKLAELLIEIATGDANRQRRLRLALAEAQSPDDLAQNVRKRLATIQRSTSYIAWNKRKALINDLEAQRGSIMGAILDNDPGEAFELCLRFLRLGDGVLSRTSSNADDVAAIFRTTCEDLPAIACRVGAGPIDLADTVFELMDDNGFGQLDGLIAAMAPSIGHQGLEHLKDRFNNLLEGGEEDDTPLNRRIRFTLHTYLRMIADAQGDVDGFIAAQDARARQHPSIALEIARRLRGAGRLQEALEALDAVRHGRVVDAACALMRAELLDELDRSSDAASFRKKCFQATLHPDFLRAYLKKLPDFEDIEAEKEALAFASTFKNALAALDFFTRWPSASHAARLVMERPGELTGDDYEILTPAAELLGRQHPLAATILLRKMINVALHKSRRNRFRYAAKNLNRCRELAGRIDDFGPIPGHDDYVASLREGFSRKRSFWGMVEAG